MKNFKWGLFLSINVFWVWFILTDKDYSTQSTILFCSVVLVVTILELAVFIRIHTKKYLASREGYEEQRVWVLLIFFVFLISCFHRYLNKINDVVFNLYTQKSKIAWSLSNLCVFLLCAVFVSVEYYLVFKLKASSERITKMEKQVFIISLCVFLLMYIGLFIWCPKYELL